MHHTPLTGSREANRSKGTIGWRLQKECPAGPNGCGMDGVQQIPSAALGSVVPGKGMRERFISLNSFETRPLVCLRNGVTSRVSRLFHYTFHERPVPVASVIGVVGYAVPSSSSRSSMMPAPSAAVTLRVATPATQPTEATMLGSRTGSL